MIQNDIPRALDKWIIFANYYIIRRAWVKAKCRIRAESKERMEEFYDLTGYSAVTYNKILRTVTIPNGILRKNLNKTFRFSGDILDGLEPLWLPVKRRSNYDALTDNIKKEIEGEWKEFIRLRLTDNKTEEQVRQYRTYARNIDIEILNILNNIEHCLSEDTVNIVLALRDTITYRGRQFDKSDFEFKYLQLFKERELRKKRPPRELEKLVLDLQRNQWNHLSDTYLDYKKRSESKTQNSAKPSNTHIYEKYRAELRKQLKLLDAIELYYKYNPEA